MLYASPLAPSVTTPSALVVWPPLLLAALISACRPGAEDIPAFDSGLVVAAAQDATEKQSSLIVLRGRVIDTAGPPPEVDPDLRARPGAGDQLMLMQFSGPVQDRWLDEVTDQGKAIIVTYLPDNAYLIWTDGPTLEKLRRLLAERAFLQWIGAFHPAYKLDPSLVKLTKTTDSPQELAVTVQLVGHDGVDASVQAILSRSRDVLRGGWTVGAYRNVRVVISQSELATIAALPDVVNVEPWLEPKLQPPRVRPPKPAGEREGDDS